MRFTGAGCGHRPNDECPRGAGRTTRPGAGAHQGGRPVMGAGGKQRRALGRRGEGVGGCSGRVSPGCGGRARPGGAERWCPRGTGRWAWRNGAGGLKAAAAATDASGDGEERGGGWPEHAGRRVRADGELRARPGEVRQESRGACGRNHGRVQGRRCAAVDVVSAGAGLRVRTSAARVPPAGAAAGAARARARMVR